MRVPSSKRAALIGLASAAMLVAQPASAIEWEHPIGSWMLIPNFGDAGFEGCSVYSTERTSKNFLVIQRTANGKRHMELLIPDADLPVGRLAPLRLSLDQSGTLDAELEIRSAKGGRIRAAAGQRLATVYAELQSDRNGWLGLFVKDARLDFPVSQASQALAALDQCVRANGQRPG